PAAQRLGLSGTGRLRQHHDPILGLSQCGEVVLEIVGLEAIDSHDNPVRVERMREERLPSRLLVARRNRILEVEDDGIRAPGSLVIAVWAVGRTEQDRGTKIETHGRAPSHQTSVLRAVVATSASSWFRARCVMGMIPCPGRDPESRLSSMVVSKYSVSPMKTGAGNETSLNPRLATSVPCVSWATDAPTMVDNVNIEFTSRWPKGWPADQAASRCRACVFMVSVVNNTLSASVT